MFIYQNTHCPGFAPELTYRFCLSKRGIRANFFIDRNTRLVEALNFTGNKLCEI